jgi:hypothetical protein
MDSSLYTILSGIGPFFKGLALPVRVLKHVVMG